MLIKPSLFLSTPFRSGSALLSRILNAHSQISLLNDNLKYFCFIHNRYLPFNEKNIKNMLDNTSSRLWTRFSLKLDIDFCLQKIKQLDLIGDASIYSILLSSLLGNKKKMIGEMEGISWNKIPYFLSLYPGSKAILIVRDLRDVLVSFKKKTIAPNYDYLIAIFNVIDAMDHFIDLKKKFPNRFFGVRFELLKEDPEREMKKVCKFLDLNYEEGIINENNWVDYHRNLWKNRQISSFYDDGDPMNPVGRWKRLITPEELYLCEWIGNKQMKNFNMQLEGNNITNDVRYNALNMLNSSELLKDAFNHWKETGKGVQKYPLDPTDSKTWDKI